VRLTFASEGADPFVDHARTWIADFAGIELVPTPVGPVDVFHGSDPHRPCRLRITKPDDLFEVLRHWLTDAAHAGLPETAFDRHDRLRPEAFVGERTRPAVNHALLAFRDRCEATFGQRARRALPPGKRAIVVLSHDVDDPVDPGDARHALWCAVAAARAGRPRAALGALRSVPTRLARGRSERHWLFDAVVALEARHGVRSSFYFAATPHFLPGGHPRDVPYDIAAPRFRRVFKHLQDAGAEVGLHMGYRARDDRALLAAEKRRLEDALGAPIQGGRHHYWHLARPFWPTLADHAAVGLTYDSSVAFNDAPGFRLATAFPFRPFDPVRSAPIPCWQIPAMAMDGAWFYDEKCTVDRALTEFSALLDQLKAAEGVGAIDWHVRASAPGNARHARWAVAYGEILALLAADREVLTLPARDALALWARGGDAAWLRTPTD